MKHTLFILLLLQFTVFGFSQNSLPNPFSYEVNRIYPAISITKGQLLEANSLKDLNKYYKPSWIKAFISVEIIAKNGGELKKAISKNDLLTQAQKDLLYSADIGADISVNVQYIPNNTLKNKEIKQIDFTFTVDPENEAKYTGGVQELEQYLKYYVIDKIAATSLKEYNLTAIKFTINEVGEVVNPHVVETSKDEKIDGLILETICNMPSWKPAAYANGTKTKQEFVFTIGDHRSCVINLLNINRG